MTYTVMLIADYWRLSKDRKLVSTHNSREEAIAAMTIAKVADQVMSYKVPARTPKAKKRQRKRRKVQRELCI